MKRIFVDTSALIALGNKRDTFHISAVKIRNQLKEQKVNFITTSAVLLEFGNAFSRISLKSTAISFIEAIKISKKWTYITIDDLIFNQGFTLYKQVQDKEWGMVDCTSILVARQMKITVIAHYNWNLSIVEMAQEYDLTEALVKEALNFSQSHKEEIEKAISAEQGLEFINV